MALTPHQRDVCRVLARGRLEPRDWVDTIACDESIQPLGYLMFAACGKDPGFSPTGLLEHAARSSRYTADDLAGLDFAGPTPDARSLAIRWHAMLETAATIIAALPSSEAGRAVIGRDSRPYRGDAGDLALALANGEVSFHVGRIRGAWPRVLAE